MVRKRTRTAQEIAWDVTTKAMASDETDVIRFVPQPDGSFRIDGPHWAVTIGADGASETTGPVPTYVAASL